ncbi:hypothetical protein F5Y09DRAFT_193930 [Xylaria sp. FL1042]|nr:hypothetical protein F5Y09DRAFT_193930 [Xylaria sp. FL1042]
MQILTQFILSLRLTPSFDSLFVFGSLSLSLISFSFFLYCGLEVSIPLHRKKRGRVRDGVRTSFPYASYVVSVFLPSFFLSLFLAR